MSYLDLYNESLAQPERFWEEQARNIQWFQFPDSILSKDEKGFYRWYKGGKMNTCYLAVDYHVEKGRGNQLALIYDSPVTGVKKQFTYHQLQQEVARLAGALKNQGVEKGDRVIIYMPMVPETVFAMLACARIGAIHSVVFGGFAANELALRIDDARPKLLLTASGGKEIDKVIAYKPIVDAALDIAKHQVDAVVVLQRDFVKADMTPGRDLDWNAFVENARPTGWVEVDATDPLYILYTSGTTGKPKGIIRDNGGHAVALNASMRSIYDVQPGEVYWAASDVGWVVGHSYIVYAPLLHGCTTILFEGKPVRTPDAGTFWRIIEEYDVKVLFTAPTAIRAIKKEDPNGELAVKYDLNNLKYLFLAGERCDVATLEWAEGILKKPVIDHWWQTESGYPMLANPAGTELLPIKPGSAGKPFFGFNIQILDSRARPMAAGEEGAVCVKLPLPPGCLPTLWENDKRFVDSYLLPYPGYYFSGDGGHKDEDGYVFITGRIDDVINVSGHRLSTSDMEEVVAAHHSVAECAVIGIEDDFRGQVPVGFVVLKGGETISEEQLEAELVQMVRKSIGALACFKQAIVVKRLPKTRSGKILRNVMRALADGKTFNPPSTIEDMSVLGELEKMMQESHVGKAFTTE